MLPPFIVNKVDVFFQLVVKSSVMLKSATLSAMRIFKNLSTRSQAIIPL